MEEHPRLHFLDAVLVKDVLNGDELDDPAGLFVEGSAFPLGIGAVAEGDEEAAPAVLAGHHRFEGIDIRPADLVGLLDLNGEPIFREHVIGRALPALGGGLGGLGADGVDAAVDATRTYTASMILKTAEIRKFRLTIASFSELL
jgi:hypothetical protein